MARSPRTELPPFSLRLTFDERAALKQAADGQASGDFIRRRLFGDSPVPRLVIYDPDGATVKWLADGLYSFAVIAPLRVPKPYRHHQDGILPCPECETRVKVANLGKHLSKVHGYRIL